MTILTPTYNRAHILKNAFDSLCRQTNFAFEWIVVDDGSIDDTEKLVNSWMIEKLPFELRYFKQKNGGKHRAINKGVQEAQYDYVLILDSDDYLTDDAVEKVHSWTKMIEGKNDFAGVSGLRGWINKPGQIGGAGNGETYIDAKNTERRKYHLDGDKAEVYRTEILKKYPFPEFEGENFLSEHVVWDTIAKEGYKLRWFSEVIYKCEYLEDGLTKSNFEQLRLKNFQGFTLSTILRKECEPFPWNYAVIGVYDYIAKLKGLDVKTTKELIQVNNWQLLIGRGIFLANELRMRFEKRV